MKKKLLVLPANGFAHTTRALKLAEALTGDYQVKAVLGHEFADLAKKLGIEAKILDHKGIDYKKVNSGRYDLFTASDHYHMAKDFEEVIDEFKPDFALQSAAISARIALEKRGVRTVSLNDAVNIRGLLDNTLMPKEHLERAEKAILGPYNEAARIYGTSELKDFKDMLSAELVLMPDLPSLFPNADIDNKHVYIGPLTWSEKTRLNSGISIDRNKPLVYVSMGSSGNENHILELAKNLRDSEYQTIITTGNISGLTQLKELERPGFYVREFLPGDQVIKLSDKTVVACHGGLGTLYQALENGAYGLILSPAHVQHIKIGKTVSDTGLGKVIADTEFGNISSHVTSILNSPEPAIKNSIANDLAKYNGPRDGRAAILAHFGN